MNEDISNKDKLRTSVWQGSVTTFDKLVENGELIKGMIYFVGDSASGGLPTSSAGGIYVATSERKAVPFGSSSEHSVKEYRTSSQFPETGRTGVIYIASDTGLMYRWDGSAYVVMGGYTDGYGIDITGAGEIKTEPISDAEIDAMNAGERNGHLLDNLGLVKLWNRIVSFFVQKEEGKGLSSNDYTDAEKTKLAGIEQGAEVNVQSDWNQTNTSADDYIKNKPSVYTKTEIDQMLAGNVKREIVSELPQTGVDGTIYMVPSATAATGDVYDEYMWLSTQGQVAAHFEKIGTTKADLANIVKVQTAGVSVGDSTHPVYVNASGEATQGSAYAGGTKVTLNNSDKGGVDATIYAPTAGGTSGQYLKSNGSTSAPSWETMDTTPTASSTKAVTSGGVKTALDAKQNSISITTNTSTPADNDTVIMQASGTTNTTMFLRRTMSKIWDYIKPKADMVYWRADKVVVNNKYTIDYNKEKIVIFPINDSFYAADERLNITWNTYNSSTDELLRSRSSEISGLFIGSYENHSNHPKENEYDIITFANPNPNYYLFGSGTFSNGVLAIHFRGALPVNAPIVTIDTGEQITRPVATFHEAGVSDYYTYTMPQRTKTLSINIQGLGDGSNSFGGASPTSIIFYRIRQNIQSDSVVTKHAVKQDLYGEVEAPKFTMRGGTSQQVLLANGTTINMPSAPGTNKDTLLRNLVSGLSVPNTNVTDTMEIITSSSGSNGFNTTNYVNIPYKRPMTKVWDYIKGKADNVYTQKGDTYTVNMSADANHQGTNEYRVLATLATADCCVLNITKTIYGYPSQNTVWFANQNAISLISLSDFGFVVIGGRSGQSADLCVPVLPTGHPAVEYKIQIVRSTDSESVTFPSSATYKTYSRPLKANVVMRDEISTDAVTFNITGGTGSVSLEDSNDFIGNVTDASTSAGITVTNYEQGQCYRFTFTEELEGVTLYSSNSVALCTVNETIQKGDVLTFTSVSNTAGGWMYSKTGASIKSSDGSVGIEWEDGVADLSVPVPTIWNDSLFWKEKNSIVVGKQCVGVRKSYNNDTLRPYLYKTSSTLNTFYLNNVTSTRYSYLAVEAGETYHVTSTNYPSLYDMDVTAPVNGYLLFVNLSAQCMVDPNIYTYSIYYRNSAGTNVSSSGNWRYCSDTASYAFIIISVSQEVIEGFQCIVLNVKHNGLYNVVAIGDDAEAAGMYSLSVGSYVKADGYAGIALGRFSNAIGTDSIAIGDNTKALYSDSIAIGFQAVSSAVDSYAIGRFSKAYGNDSIALGFSTLTEAQNAIAIGYQSKARGSKCAVIGYNNEALNTESVILGISALAKDYSVVVGSNSNSFGYQCIAVGCRNNASKPNTLSLSKTDYPYLGTSKFKCKKFKHNGVDEFIHLCTDRQNVTINVDGTDYTLSTNFSNDRNFFIVVDAYVTGNTGADCAVNYVDAYMEVDGVMKKQSYEETGILYVEKLGDTTYYAIWSSYSNINYMYLPTDSLNVFMTYYKNTDNQRAIALGNSSEAYAKESIVIGNYLNAISIGQIVIGRYNSLDVGAKFIIGAGTSYNARKNILTIDEKEIVHARAYISDAVTYELNGASVSLGTVTMGLLKVTGGGTLTLTSTNAVEGHCVKVYASGSDITCNGDSITAGRWREYLFIDGAWRSKM